MYFVLLLLPGSSSSFNSVPRSVRQDAHTVQSGGNLVKLTETCENLQTQRPSVARAAGIMTNLKR